MERPNLQLHRGCRHVEKKWFARINPRYDLDVKKSGVKPHQAIHYSIEVDRDCDKSCGGRSNLPQLPRHERRAAARKKAKSRDW